MADNAWAGKGDQAMLVLVELIHFLHTKKGTPQTWAGYPPVIVEVCLHGGTSIIELGKRRPGSVVKMSFENVVKVPKLELKLLFQP